MYDSLGNLVQIVLKLTQGVEGGIFKKLVSSRWRRRGTSDAYHDV